MSKYGHKTAILFSLLASIQVCLLIDYSWKESGFLKKKEKSQTIPFHPSYMKSTL